MKLALATIWILIGGVVLGGLYWTFLITPVSTALALIATALLAIATLAVAGLVANLAIETWSRGFSMPGARRALGSIGSIVPAGLIILLLWWMTSGVEMWVAENSGQINAWFIARFGWDNMSWLFSTIRYSAMWLRWVLGAMLALSLMAGVLTLGWRGIAQPTWITRALRPRALLGATLWFGALIVVPWMFLVPWKPENLPATSIEMVFIITKLSIAAILAALGLALVTREASWVPSGPQTTSSLPQ
jgi:hypothetical protein